MHTSRLVGITLVTAGTVLLGTMLYEPATLVKALGVEHLLSEGSVVLLCLFLVSACGIGAVTSLRRSRRDGAAPELSGRQRVG